MKKKEVIWREILFQYREHKTIKFTQKELAEKFSFSVSTVFHALKSPRASHAIRVTGRFFILEDYKKLLYLLASEHNLEKDIYYRTFLKMNIHEIESLMPPEVTFGLYSGFKFLYNAAPADYDHSYVYAETKHLPKIQERISHVEEKKSQKMYPNFFVINPDKWLSRYPHLFFEQLFVDIWNAPEWYAKDFLKKLEEKLS